MKNNNNSILEQSQTLANFLRDYRILPGEKEYKPTHTSLPCVSHGAGSYHIPSDKNSELYELIHKHVFIKKNELSLTESHYNFSYSPLIDDIDTRDPQEENPCMERKYEMSDVKEYCCYLVDSLEKYCNLTEEQRLVYVFQKKKPSLDSKTKMVKDGWHIMMPHLVVPYELSYLARSNRVMNSSVRELFERLGYANTVEDIIDHRVIEVNNWFMYGASKPGKEAYKLTKIYKIRDGHAVEMTKKSMNIENERDLIELLSIRNKELNVRYWDNVDIEEIYSKLPDTHKSSRHVTVTKKENNKTIRKRPRNIVINKTCHDIEIIKKYINCLSINRANSYDEWIRVGWCLHNIDFSLLESWIEFSKQSSKFIPGECEEAWYRMKGEGLGLGTLRMWARNDNPRLYAEIKQEDTENILLKCLHKGHTNISEYIKAKYQDEFICAGIGNKEWYQYTGHRWKYIEDGWALRDKIAREVGYDFQEFASKCYKDMTNNRYDNNGAKKYNIAQDVEQQKNATVFQMYHKKFSEMANRIGDTAFLNNLMNECKFRFYDENFKNKLDENDNLLHFTNGVYDLEKDEFREGYPEDFISLSTNIEFIEDPDEYDYETLGEIQQFFEQVLPNDNVREYALTLMGSFLSGKNKEQKFYIWTGSGSNGKSMTIDLFNDTLGDYSGTISVAIFTKGRLDANAPSPAVAKLKGKRFISLQEPENEDKLHMGIIKQWVGGDPVQARELNKAPVEFIMKAKFVLVCNDLPQIDALDGGTWRRIRLLEFLSKFVDSPKRPNEFKIDRKLKDKMEQWREMFMWMLINYHRKYKKMGIHEPPEVTRVTDEYKKNSDFYSQFFNEHIVKDLNSRLSIKDAYKYFKSWQKTTYEGKKLMLKQNFENHMNLLMGKYIGGYWQGYRYVDADEIDSDDECPNKMSNNNPDNDAENDFVIENDMYSRDIEYEIIEENDITDSESENEEIIKVIKKVPHGKIKKTKSNIKKKGKKYKQILIEESDSDND